MLAVFPQDCRLYRVLQPCSPRCGNAHLLARGEPGQTRHPKTGDSGVHSRDFLLRPLQVLAHLPRILHALCKASPRSRQPRLRLFLQFKQLTVLGVQAARTRGTPDQLRFSPWLQIKRIQDFCKCDSSLSRPPAGPGRHLRSRQFRPEYLTGPRAECKHTLQRFCRVRAEDSGARRTSRWVVRK